MSRVRDKSFFSIITIVSWSHLLSTLLVWLLNELATRWSERSVSLVLREFKMRLPPPVTPHRVSHVTAHRSKPPLMCCHPLRADALLTCPSRVSDSCPRREQNRLSNQLISSWDGAGQKRIGKSFDVSLFFCAVAHKSFKLEMKRCVSESSSFDVSVFSLSGCLL